MFKEEVWALEPERIETFFLHHREVHATADGYRVRDCRITVTVLPPPQDRRFGTASDQSHL